MATFQNFTAAQKEEIPDFMKAAQMKADAEANALRERNQNIQGGAMLYDKATGENTPIRDYLSQLGGESAISDSAFTNSMATDQGLSSSLFGDAASLSGETAIAEGGVNDALMGEIFGGAGEVGTNLGVEGALNMGTDLASTAAMDASMVGADALLAGGTEAALASQAAITGAETAALAGGAEVAGATALGTAGAAIPPLLMAALLSRALGLWS